MDSFLENAIRGIIQVVQENVIDDSQQQAIACLLHHHELYLNRLVKFVKIAEDNSTVFASSSLTAHVLGSAMLLDEILHTHNLSAEFVTRRGEYLDYLVGLHDGRLISNAEEIGNAYTSIKEYCKAELGHDEERR